MGRGKGKIESVILSREKSSSESGYGQHRLYTGQEEKRKFRSKAGVLCCTKCGAYSFKKHWFIDSDSRHDVLKGHEIKEGLCPGCERIEKMEYQGEVVVNADLVDKDAVIELMKNVEGKCWHDNPSSRIALVEEKAGKMKINTTSKWLAIRIGKELYKSHKGKLEIKPAEDEDYVRVHWSI